MEHKLKCQYCKKQFKAKRKDAKYCSTNCRQNAAYERKFNDMQKELDK